MPDVKESKLRKTLADNLRDLAGQLETGRGKFITWNKSSHKNLKKAIDDVLKILDKHEGEDKLENLNRWELDIALNQMRNCAKAYVAEKREERITETTGAEYMRSRVKAAAKLAEIDPGFKMKFALRADELKPKEPESKSKKEQRKKEAQKIAPKQIAAYLKEREEKINPNGPLTQEEFNALINADSVKMITYKDDPELCRKYPQRRMQVELALHAAKKLSHMQPADLVPFWAEWEKSTREDGLAAAKKKREREGFTFSASEEEKVKSKLSVYVEDTKKKYKLINSMIDKAKETEQIGRYLDIKMDTICNPHYLDKKKNFSEKELDQKIQDAQDKLDVSAENYYQNLKDLKELRGAGIKHITTGGKQGAKYQSIKESANTTTKREFWSYKVTKAGTVMGADASNKALEPLNKDAKEVTDETVKGNISIYGKSAKLHVGKIGGKLHTKHKTVQAGVNLSMGNLKGGATVNAALFKNGKMRPDLNVSVSAEATALQGNAKLKVGGKQLSLAAKGKVQAGYASGYATARAGFISYENEKGEKVNALGAQVAAGGSLALVKGSVSGTLNILGVKITAGLTGIVAGVADEVEAHLTTDEVGFSLAGALGIGGGLSVSINWKGALDNIRKLWRGHKLNKLIEKTQEEKQRNKVEEDDKEDEFRSREQDGFIVIDPKDKRRNSIAGINPRENQLDAPKAPERKEKRRNSIAATNPVKDMLDGAENKPKGKGKS